MVEQKLSKYGTKSNEKITNYSFYLKQIFMFIIMVSKIFRKTFFFHLQIQHEMEMIYKKKKAFNFENYSLEW